MKDYKATVGKIIKGEISELSLDEVKAMVEVPGDEAMGDYAFPCFKLAKTLKKAPPLIAKKPQEHRSVRSGAGAPTHRQDRP